jgi:hypothetical protein
MLLGVLMIRVVNVVSGENIYICGLLFVGISEYIGLIRSMGWIDEYLVEFIRCIVCSN